jgi:hypothetical protein
VKELAMLAPVGTVVIDELERVRGRGCTRRSSGLVELEALAAELKVAILAAAKSMPRRATTSMRPNRRTIRLRVDAGTTRTTAPVLVVLGAGRSPGPNEA